MADRLMSLSGVIFLLGMMVNGIASGAEITIENRAGVIERSCGRLTDTSIIRLQIDGQDVLPHYTDTTNGTDNVQPSPGRHITGDPNITKGPNPNFFGPINTSNPIYTVVIEMGSWTQIPSGNYVQRRSVQYTSLPGGCGVPYYRYLAFAVTQGPGLLTLQVKPKVELDGTIQYQVVVQSGTATLSMPAVGQKTITDFGQTRDVGEKPVLNAQRFSVAENSAAATVVGTLVATDPDGVQPLTYRVTGGTGQGVFAVNLTTGQITVANSSLPDFETTPTFTLQVQVTDNGTPPLSASAPITIDLTDVNEKPVLNAQRFSVAENSAAATVVGTLVATDPDGVQPLTYRVTGGTGQGVFAVNLTTGQITVANSSLPDFETTPTFTLQVQVTDNGTPPLSASAPITIDLTDVNEGDQVPPASPGGLVIR